MHETHIDVHCRSYFLAQESGQLFVAAAGNNFNNNDNSPQYPASIPNRIVMGVASVDAAERLSSFSNYGRETVDIAAPGSSILSTWPGGGYESISGTSMATPLVSGTSLSCRSYSSGRHRCSQLMLFVLDWTGKFDKDTA